MFAKDLRRGEERTRSPLDASWLIQANDVFLPVCSFGDRRKAICILFLDELLLDKPEDAGNAAFWMPWVERSLAVAQVLVGGDPSVGMRERAAIWQISDGALFRGVLVTPAAQRNPGPHFRGVAAEVQSMLLQILDVECGLAAVCKIVSEHEHRLARTPHRHRLPRRHPGGAGKPTRKS